MNREATAPLSSEEELRGSDTTESDAQSPASLGNDLFCSPVTYEPSMIKTAVPQSASGLGSGIHNRASSKSPSISLSSDSSHSEQELSSAQSEGSAGGRAVSSAPGRRRSGTTTTFSPLIVESTQLFHGVDLGLLSNSHKPSSDLFSHLTPRRSPAAAACEQADLPSPQVKSNMPIAAIVELKQKHSPDEVLHPRQHSSSPLIAEAPMIALPKDFLKSGRCGGGDASDASLPDVPPQKTGPTDLDRGSARTGRAARALTAAASLQALAQFSAVEKKCQADP